jgi:hypothetical protein
MTRVPLLPNFPLSQSPPNNLAVCCRLSIGPNQQNHHQPITQGIEFNPDPGKLNFFCEKAYIKKLFLFLLFRKNKNFQKLLK